MLDKITEKIEAYAADDEDNEAKNAKERLSQIVTILKGEIRDRLYLQFLKKNNHMDMQVIHNIKKSIG